MLRKEITYMDYDNNPITEKLYFNFSKPELMELGLEGKLLELVERVQTNKDFTSFIQLIKELLQKAYGQKSEDGRRFIKSKELSEEFSQTEAYTVLFMELIENPEKLDEFIRGVIPADLLMQIPAQLPESNAVL